MPLRWLYVVNAAILITHEIDSAYWHEWELFGLPGGIQLFLALNLALVVVVLAGLQALAQGLRWGLVASWFLAGAGIFAAAVHGVFLARGSSAFTLPASLALLAATAVVSAVQAYATAIQARRPG